MSRHVSEAERAHLRARLTEEAHRQLGKPYKYGAYWQEAPKRFDCSSYVQYLYKQVGVTIPRVSIEQARQGRRVSPRKDALKVGDLIFTRSTQGRYDPQFPQGIGHVYIVTGANEVCHARSRKPSGVVRQRLTTILERKDITVIRRII